MSTETRSSYRRSRVVLVATLGLTIAIGLLSRSSAAEALPWIHRNAGDALWAVCVYLGLLLVSPSQRPSRAAAFAAILSLIVELSQLSEAGWLQTLRGTQLGRLLLGVGWQTVDLLRYACGILAVAALDALLAPRARTISKSADTDRAGF